MNQRIIHNLVQGTPEWEAFRLEHDGASEAAAAMGLSKKVTRSELLRMKHTGIAKEFSDWVQKNILDYGHDVEARARPLIEQLIGEELFPVTMSYGRLSASCDGLTMDSDTAYEHKQWAEELAAAVRRKELLEEHQPQCQQIMEVTGAKRVIFTVSDGTPDKLVWMEVLPDPEWVKRIEAAWAQFHEDLNNYTPPEVIPAAVAEPQMALPALAVNVSGALEVRDNLAAFGDALKSYVERINKTPETDQDFVNLEASAKLLREAQTKIAAARDSALGQVVTIDSMKRTADLLEEVARKAAIECENIVKREKENRRTAIIRDAQMSVGAHIANLNARLGKPYMPTIAADFAGVVKGLKTIASLQNAVDTELASVKIEANEIADRIEINLNYLRENAADYKFLFADAATIVLKQKDDFEALAKLRIAEHKEAEAKRLEAETLRIRAEEEARARAEAAAAAKAEAERIAREQREADQMISSEINGIRQQIVIAQAGRLGVRVGGTIECIGETLAETEAWQIDDRFGVRIDEAQIAKDTAILSIRSLLEAAEKKAAQPNTTAAPAANAPAANEGTGETPAPGQRETQQDTGATIKLGEIGHRLGFTVTAEFLGLLGFTFTTEKNAKLYRLADFPRICAAIARHCDAVGSASIKVAA